MIPLIGMGWTEVLVIAGVVVVLFGASRIPAIFRSLGEGINSFKEGLEGKDGTTPPGQLPGPSTKDDGDDPNHQAR
jgi:sec-independent protein translocase protein TatA